MREYYVKEMVYAKPEPRHKLCWRDGMVSLQQRGKDNFAVRYGMQVHAELTYGEACKQLGQALMHQLSCDDLVDNRTKNER